jgi:uncharacterized protein YtpQ (UPF0354 family)
MTRMLAVLLGLVVCATAVAAELISRRDFAKRMEMAFRAADPKAITRADENEIVFGGLRDGIILTMPEAYALYAQNPGRLDEIIGGYVEITLKGLKDRQRKPARSEPDRSRIIPVIKDRRWLEDNIRSLRARGSKQEFLTEALNSELVIVYAQDSENRTRYLMTSEDVGDRKELRKLAVQNLMRLLPNAIMENIGDVTIIRAGGDYEASLLLFDHLWSGGKINGQIAVDGDIVVAVPAKDAVLVTGSRSRKGLEVLREIAAKEMRGPFPLTDTLFVYRGGRFEKFEE